MIKDINPWGPLWQIIVENIPLFQDEFFELFSAQVLIQYHAWIVPDAKFVLFDVVIISVIVIILRPRLSDITIEFECSNAKMIIWNNWRRFNVPPFQVNSTTTTDFCLSTVYVHAIWKTNSIEAYEHIQRGIEVPRHKSLQLIHRAIQEGRHESYLLDHYIR